MLSEQEIDEAADTAFREWLEKNKQQFMFPSGHLDKTTVSHHQDGFMIGYLAGAAFGRDVGLAEAALVIEAAVEDEDYFDGLEVADCIRALMTSAPAPDSKDGE